MANNLIVNGNFWNGINGYAKDGVTYELKRYDHFFDYCEFKSDGTRNDRFCAYFNNVAGSGFVAGNTYRIGFWGRSDNSARIFIGCYDEPLTFQLTPVWTWYESEYTPSISLAVSIRNIDRVNTVCFAGLWVQDGNDPIIPETSPYIEIVELTNNQVALDATQIEQGGINAAAEQQPYSVVKEPGTGSLSPYRVRSRNLFKVPSANREIEILGDISGLEYSICEFNSDKKMIEWHGWYSDLKHYMHRDTRYVSFLVRTTTNSLITPQQFVARGGYFV